MSPSWAPVRSQILHDPKASLPQFPHVSGQGVVVLGSPGQDLGAMVDCLCLGLWWVGVEEEEERSAASTRLSKGPVAPQIQSPEPW